MHARLVALLAAPLLSSALQCHAPLVMRHPRTAASTLISRASPADNWINGKKDAFNAEKQAKISQLEQCIDTFEPSVDDPKAFGEMMEQLLVLKKEGLAVGSSEWAAVVVKAEQRSEAFKKVCAQYSAQRGDAYIRDRDRAEREAAAGLIEGSRDWYLAMNRANKESSQAYLVAEKQMKEAREAANRKRAALLEALFSDSATEPTPAVMDAALDVLFNSGYDVEGAAAEGGLATLTNADVKRMQGIIASTTAALTKGDSRDIALLLKRAALLVAVGETALARADYEAVLSIDPTNPEAKKYFDRASYGQAFDAYEILGVSRDATQEVISVAFRRLAKQWHPDRWAQGTEAEKLEAETRFKQLNLAQGVLMDAAKRRQYDAGTASVADLMMGWWEKMTKGKDWWQGSARPPPAGCRRAVRRPRSCAAKRLWEARRHLEARASTS